EVSRSEAPATRRLGEEIHERWSRGEYAELGRIVTGTRSSAAQLEEVATAAERCGRQRLGGYAGAWSLGPADAPARHVGEGAGQGGEMAPFAGGQHRASIGGSPLVPPASVYLPRPSHTLGTETPDYDEDA